MTELQLSQKDQSLSIYQVGCDRLPNKNSDGNVDAVIYEPGGNGEFDINSSFSLSLSLSLSHTMQRSQIAITSILRNISVDIPNQAPR